MSTAQPPRGWYSCQPPPGGALPGGCTGPGAAPHLPGPCWSPEAWGRFPPAGEAGEAPARPGAQVMTVCTDHVTDNTYAQHRRGRHGESPQTGQASAGPQRAGTQLFQVWDPDPSGAPWSSPPALPRHFPDCGEDCAWHSPEAPSPNHHTVTSQAASRSDQHARQPPAKPRPGLLRGVRPRRHGPIFHCSDRQLQTKAAPAFRNPVTRSISW